MRFKPFSHLFRVASALLLSAKVASALPTDCAELGNALVEHSCFHTIYGPFRSVQATSGVLSEGATPDLSSVHTEYRVGLAGDVSMATYTPERSGAWTIFLGSGVPFRVFDQAGREVERIFSASGDVGCPGLAEAHVYELAEGELYRIVFGPTTATSVVAVVEFIDDFLIENGRDVDGDGYGTADHSIRSPCVPPAGYVQNTSDCDDENALLNPGIEEVCDGVDQNCNGLADDLGLECRVGQGACLVVGTLSCEGLSGDVVGCSAQALAPAVETCNGKDDDCDGAIDGNDDDLCNPADSGPTCVREGFGAFCGCLLDQDCGGPDSGRVCDVELRRCNDGCATDLGRNGCPQGSTCVVGTSSGTCEPMADASDASAGADSTDTAEPGDEAAQGNASDVSGCGCHVGPQRPNELAGLLAALALALLAIRRRPERWLQARVASSGVKLAAVVALAVSASWGCGGRVVDEGAPPPPVSDGIGGSGDTGPEGSGGAPECSPVLGSVTVEHACAHTDHGPYVSVVALASKATDVSELHKTFSILAVDQEASLTYRPKRMGEHVLLTDQNLAIEVLEQGSIVPLEGPAFDVEGCSTMVQGLRADLVSGETYELRLIGPPETAFKLFIEYPPAFGAKAWEQECTP